MNADQIWRTALVRNHETEYAIGQRYTDLLITLLTKGPDHGSALMRRIGDTHQPNTVRRLQRLDSLGFVIPREVVVRVPRGGSTTTSRALEWRLTRAGRELASALRDEARAAVSPSMRGREYWPVGDIRPRAARGTDARVAYWPVSA
jgi:DNA-binding HxlR family transcriptional regulator